jgi:hypothetical protein
LAVDEKRVQTCAAQEGMSEQKFILPSSRPEHSLSGLLLFLSHPAEGLSVKNQNFLLEKRKLG